MSIQVVDLADEVGISYRQADYWIRCGHITAPGSGGTGSGYRRRLSDEEAETFRAMAALVKAGFTPARAAELARHPLNVGDRVFYWAGNGITVILQGAILGRAA